MADKVVGHGPTLDFGPRVPDFLVVQDDHGRLRIVSREGDVLASPEAFTTKTEQCSPQPLVHGSWPVVFEGVDHPLGGPVPRMEWLPLGEETRWRQEMARKALAAAQGISGNPELTLRTLRASSAFMSVDLEKVAREVAEIARPTESLADAYVRSKG